MGSGRRADLAPVWTCQQDRFRETRKPELETTALLEHAASAHDAILCVTLPERLHCEPRRFHYVPAMANELAIIDAEDLKSRVRELGRFL